MKYNILVTGGSGLAGEAFKRVINKKRKDILFLSSKECDLRDKVKTFKLFDDVRPKFVYHLAGRVGGVKANLDYMADFYVDNMYINLNVLCAAKEYGVKKLVSLLSSCVFPDAIDYPLTEEKLHNGFPHETNYGYAFSKRMLDIHSRVYRKQYGCNFICAIVNNLFGMDDQFDYHDSHVIPAIIRKIYEAKINNKESVEFWGNGENLREFTFSEDAVEALIFLFNNYDGSEPINIGNTEEHSIKEVVNLTCKIVGYDGSIIWNTNEIGGQYKKPSSNEKFLQLGWKKEKYTPFDKAFKRTVGWFQKTYPNIRGF